MPEIRVTCSGCQATLRLADTLAGKKVRCPKCKTVIPVPAAGAEPAPAPAPSPAPPRGAEPARTKPAAPPPELDEEPAPAMQQSEAPRTRPAAPPPEPAEEISPSPQPAKRKRPADEDDDEVMLAEVTQAPAKKRPVADEEEDRPRPRSRRPLDEDEDEPPAKKPVKKGMGVFGALVVFATVLMLLSYAGAFAAVLLEFYEPPLPGIDDAATHKRKKDERARLKKLEQDKDKGKTDKGEPLELTRNDNEEKTIAAARDQRLANAKAAELKTAEQLARNASQGTSNPLAIARIGGKNDPFAFGQTAFSPDGQTLAELRDNKKLVLWNLLTGQRLRELDAGHPVKAFAFSQDGSALFAATDGKKHLGWLVKTGHPEYNTNVPFTDVEPAYSRHAQRFAAIPATGGTTPKVWDFVAGGEPRQLEGTYLTTGAKAFRPDGKVLAMACQPQGQGQMIVLFDTETGKRYKRTIGVSADAIAFSPDGWTLASKKDREVRLIDVATGTDKILAHDNNVASLVFTPDGKHLLTTTDTHLRVWNVASGTEHRKLDMSLYGLSVSPGGVFLTANTREVWLLSDLLDDSLLKNLEQARKLAEVRRTGLGFHVELKPEAKIATLTELKKLLRLGSVSLLFVQGVDDAWLVELKPLTDLRQLTLVGARVTNAGLANLAGMKELESLDLSGAEQVSDEGLAHLHKLKNLKQVNLAGTKVTDQGVAVLKNALPKVNVTK